MADTKTDASRHMPVTCGLLEKAAVYATNYKTRQEVIWALLEAQRLWYFRNTGVRFCLAGVGG